MEAPAGNWLLGMTGLLQGADNSKVCAPQRRLPVTVLLSLWERPKTVLQIPGRLLIERAMDPFVAH